MTMNVQRSKTRRGHCVHMYMYATGRMQARRGGETCRVQNSYADGRLYPEGVPYQSRGSRFAHPRFAGRQLLPTLEGLHKTLPPNFMQPLRGKIKSGLSRSGGAR